MRITPIILIAIGIFILIYPEKMLSQGESARWVGAVVIALGAALFWNAWRRMRKDKKNNG